MERRSLTVNMEDLEQALRNAVRDGVKELMRDPEVRAAMGASLYDAFVMHGSKDAKIWVGGKVMAALATMLLAAAITFYVKYK